MLIGLTDVREKGLALIKHGLLYLQDGKLIRRLYGWGATTSNTRRYAGMPSFDVNIVIKSSEVNMAVSIHIT